MGKRLVNRYMAKLVLLTVLALGGCATQQYHDWYEGESASAAVIKSTETILIESINGRETDATFIGQNHSYELPSGEYTLVVTYADIFDKTADDFEKVKSNPVKMTVNLDAGKRYQFEHRVIERLSDAEAFAEKPIFKLLDIATGKEIVANVEYTTPRSILSSLKFESEQEQVFVSDYIRVPKDKPVISGKGKTSDADLSALKMLKFSWKQATSQDREAFLQWVNQQ